MERNQTKGEAWCDEVLEKALGGSDDQLGKVLLTCFVAVQADDCGIPISAIPEDFIERVRQHVLAREAQTAQTAAVEKALHKAARGEFEVAGKLLREHMWASAAALKFIPIGINRTKQAVDFGRKGGHTKKAQGDANRERVLSSARTILKNRSRKPSLRELASLVSRETGIPVDTVRGHLTKLEKSKELD